MSFIEVIAKEIPHPFNCYLSTTQLNPKAFVCIEGEGAYEEYSWKNDGNNFEPDVDAGSAVEIHVGNVDLYENNDSITVVLSDICKGYRYPKEHFSLIKKSV
jgi:hypothetical protein